MTCLLGTRSGRVTSSFPHHQVAQTGARQSSVATRLKNGLRQVAYRLVERGIVEDGRKVNETLGVAPLIKDGLKRAVCDQLKGVLQIEAHIELWAEAWVEFGGAYGRVTVRGPFPDGKHLWVVGAQRGYILRVWGDCYRYSAV